jgi:glycosyltransferase involved in cell wall biosynthesis
MRIAFFAPSWPPGHVANGIVTYLSQLVPELRRLGHKVFVITPGKAADCDDPYTIDLQALAPTRTVWDRLRFRLAPEATQFNAMSSMIASVVTKLVEVEKVDVLEMEESFGWSYEVSRRKLLPVVVKLHGPWFLSGKANDDDTDHLNRRRQEWEGRAIQHAQFVTSPSVAVLQAVKSHYDVKLAASRVVPNPVKATTEEKRWNIETCNNERLLFVGRFDQAKGGDLILRAFAQLAMSNPWLKLTFVGPDRGIKRPDGKILSFDKFVRSRFPDACRSRIEFYGQMTHSDVMSLRTRHFSTIVASPYETFPYAVLEAMSLGCPVVATAVGGIPEIIKNLRNGLLVPSQNVEAVAAACQKLLDDRALAVRIGHQAWQDCREFYGSETIAKQTILVYQEAIDSFRFRSAA